MIEVVIDSIGINPTNYQPVLLLKEKTSERFLPIWIGTAEANAIAVKLQGVDVPRPLSHDLIWSVISTLKASVDSVIITELRGDTFFGEIILNTPEGKIAIDSRPSDALALAVRARSPIFSEEAVLDKVGLLIDRETDQATLHGTSEETPITEDDLKKLSAYTDFIDTLDIDDFGKGPRKE